MSHEVNVDERIHNFISRKITTPNTIADWFGNKFGARDSEIQNGETVIGMKYEPASRGKI